MKTLMIKRLALGDSPVSTEDATAMAERLEEAMTLHPKAVHVFGAFANDQLVSALVGEISKRFSSDWLMSYLVTDVGKGLFWNYNKNGLEGCWGLAFDFFEKYGYTNVNWSLPTRWESTQKRTQRTSALWAQYDIRIIDRIKAGELPSDEKLRWVFGQHPKSYDVTLKSASRNL